MPSLIQFIVVAIVCAIFLWALTQFPTLNPSVVKMITILVLVVLTIMALNVVLVLLFAHPLAFYLGGS